MYPDSQFKNPLHLGRGGDNAPETEGVEQTAGLNLEGELPTRQHQAEVTALAHRPFRSVSELAQIEDKEELAFELRRSHIDLTCPEIQALIRSTAVGGIFGEFAQGLLPLPARPKPPKIRRPKRSPTSPSPALPSLFESFGIPLTSDKA
jgi:hypothetical protein